MDSFNPHLRAFGTHIKNVALWGAGGAKVREGAILASFLAASFILGLLLGDFFLGAAEVFKLSFEFRQTRVAMQGLQVILR